MESNLKIGSNGAGLFIGTNEIIGGEQQITLTNLYENSLPKDVFIVNLTNSKCLVAFYYKTDPVAEVNLNSFEVTCEGSFRPDPDGFEIHVENAGNYNLCTNLKRVTATNDSYGEINVPVVESVNNNSITFDTDYESDKWELVSQSTKRQDAFAGGWIVISQ